MDSTCTHRNEGGGTYKGDNDERDRKCDEQRGSDGESKQGRGRSREVARCGNEDDESWELGGRGLGGREQVVHAVALYVHPLSRRPVHPFTH